MPKSVLEIFRDYVMNGVPDSGAHEPDKRDIRDYLLWLEGYVGTGGATLEMRVSGGYLQFRVTEESPWINLVPVSEISDAVDADFDAISDEVVALGVALNDAIEALGLNAEPMMPLYRGERVRLQRRDRDTNAVTYMETHEGSIYVSSSNGLQRISSGEIIEPMMPL